MSVSKPHYFVPQPVVWPFVLAVSLFFLFCGLILALHDYASVGNPFMLGAVIVMVAMIAKWFDAIIQEAETQQYGKWEDASFRNGMVWFIASEVAFFAGFFGALYYVRIISLPELAGLAPELQQWTEFAGGWPSAGPEGAAFKPMGAWGIPAINTLLLLSSGATVTWAHWGLLKKNRDQLIKGLIATVALGVVFLILQAYEYVHAYNDLGLTLGAGVYGATFFLLTGFHGMHVTLGTVMLLVILGRSMRGHFTPQRHFGFEGVAWYWHFVDVVWLILFVFVYWL